MARNEVVMTTESFGFIHFGWSGFQLWPYNLKPTEKSVPVTTLLFVVSQVENFLQLKSINNNNVSQVEHFLQLKNINNNNVSQAENSLQLKEYQQ